MNACKACGAPIFYGITVKGKRMPIDQSPVDEGNVIWTSATTVRVLTKAERDDSQFDNRKFRSHYVTCPRADEFRKVKT